MSDFNENDLQAVLEEMDKATEEVSLRQRDLLDYLRNYIANWTKQNPDVHKKLSTDVAAESMAELYQALMEELDQLEEWDFDDALEGTSLFMLMAIGMYRTNDESKEPAANSTTQPANEG